MQVFSDGDKQRKPLPSHVPLHVPCHVPRQAPRDAPVTFLDDFDSQEPRIWDGFHIGHMCGHIGCTSDGSYRAPDFRSFFHDTSSDCCLGECGADECLSGRTSHAEQMNPDMFTCGTDEQAKIEHFSKTRLQIVLCDFNLILFVSYSEFCWMPLRANFTCGANEKLSSIILR